MTHNMKLNPEPFNMISSGQKTIELRLNDEKRQLINVGDKIVFTNTADSEQKITAVVVDLHKFNSFEELYDTLPLLKCGYTEKDIIKANPKDMELYYSKEQQKKYGVLGIEIRITSK
ncbi:MAG: ASCH domain-containing protein [Ruminococcus sp.]